MLLASVLYGLLPEGQKKLSDEVRRRDAKFYERLEATDKVDPCWGLGSGVKDDPGPWQGELRNMYKPTAVEALWFHGGNLALQLHARRAAVT